MPERPRARMRREERSKVRGRQMCTYSEQVSQPTTDGMSFKQKHLCTVNNSPPRVIRIEFKYIYIEHASGFLSQPQVTVWEATRRHVCVQRRTWLASESRATGPSRLIFPAWGKRAREPRSYTSVNFSLNRKEYLYQKSRSRYVAKHSFSST